MTVACAGRTSLYVGHFAVALAGASVARRIPLVLLVVAAFGADLVEAVLAAFYVADPERMWSHSLAATLLLGGAIALAWRLRRRGTPTEASILVVLAASHTALDLITSRKAWWPGGAAIGLEIYQQPWLDLGVEWAMVLVGWWIWRKSIPQARRNSALTLTALALLLCMQLGIFAAHLWHFNDDPTALSKFVR